MPRNFLVCISNSVQFGKVFNGCCVVDNIFKEIISRFGGENIRRLIIHVHRNPNTGVWSIMKDLVRVQNQQHGVISILGVLADKEWQQSSYGDELHNIDLPYVLASVPKLFGTGAFFLFIVSNPLRKWIRKFKKYYPEMELIVHSHSAWLSGAYVPLPICSGFGMVATFHGIADDHRLRSVWWLRRTHRYLVKRLCFSRSVLTSVSNETVSRAEEIFDIPQEAFHVVPNGLSDNKPFASVLPDIDGFFVGHVGQLHPGKGWHLLAEAVTQLRQEGFNIHLVLAGKGQDVEKVKQFAEAHEDYVHFLGQVPNAGRCLIPYLDALVLASWSEGMPMTIIEAFSAGVPVVATAVGGIPEIVENEVNGLLIERNSEAISLALKQLLTITGLKDTLGRNAIETFEEKLNIAQVVSLYNELYNISLTEK